jgi:anti-sigma-K factor RskA
MNEREHTELQELLGAFVLNAVDPLEHRRIERHIASCEECAREVRLLGVPAAELSVLPMPADADDLVEKIASSLPWRPRKALTRLSAAIAAVAVVVAGYLGVTLRNQNAREEQITTVIAGADRTVKLDAAEGFGGRGHLYLAGDDAVLALDNVPDAGRDRAYQLWALTGNQPRSMAVLDGEGRIVHLFEWQGDATGFAVTIEPAGGSPVPTSDPVLVSA